MPKYRAQQFIKAIPGTGGVISDIADRVGCKWHTAKKYIDDYVSVKEAYDEECNRVSDAAKGKIVNAITKRKDLQTSKWWLTVKDPEFTPKEKREISGTVTWEQYVKDNLDE